MRINSFILKIVLNTTCLLWADLSMAISVGEMSYFMGPIDTHMARPVHNDSNKARYYQVTVEESEPPYAGASKRKVSPGTLMFAPKQLLLRPNETKWLKLYYQGPADDQARFYRVSFHEKPGYMSGQALKPVYSGTVSLGTILVVQPRQAHQGYSIENNVLKNSGNTVYLAYIEGICADAEPCFRERYLAPGAELPLNGLQARKLFLSNETTVEKILE